MFKTLKVEPVLTLPKGGEVFTTIATSMGFFILQDRELKTAFFELCAAKGHPKTYISEFAEYCLAESVANTSVEGDTTYGAYSLDAGMFAARVNILGLPHIKAVVVAAVPDTLQVHTHFYVMEGRLNGMVELFGVPATVNANTRAVRDILRLYGFGDIETLDGMKIEEDGRLSVATLASRTLPY